MTSCSCGVGISFTGGSAQQFVFTLPGLWAWTNILPCRTEDPRNKSFWTAQEIYIHWLFIPQYTPSILMLGNGQAEGFLDSDKTEHLVSTRHSVRAWRWWKMWEQPFALERHKDAEGQMPAQHMWTCDPAITKHTGKWSWTLRTQHGERLSSGRWEGLWHPFLVGHYGAHF